MESRKKEHINLAFESSVGIEEQDLRFNYEPMLSSHPTDGLTPFDFLGKKMNAPIWISSMTGGTEKANKINKNLARAANEFGLGMGLGSCRIILEDDTYFDDFNLRDIIGSEYPFYANLGIAQIEKVIENKKFDVVKELMFKLQVDGLIIHVNPLQEWLQPEGDRLKRSPIDTITEFIEHFEGKIIVKEVGQGIGPESLKKLLQLPLAAIDFGAFGGTNFAKLELLRNNQEDKEIFEPFSKIGHNAYQMVEFINKASETIEFKFKEFIISGGIKNFLDGYYLLNKLKFKAVYGQASNLLKYASESYEALKNYLSKQIEGLSLAFAFLRVI